MDTPRGNLKIEVSPKMGRPHCPQLWGQWLKPILDERKVAPNSNALNFEGIRDKPKVGLTSMNGVITRFSLIIWLGYAIIISEKK